MSASTTTASTTTSATTPSGKRKKRDSAALTCPEIPAILVTISALLNEGYATGIYPVSPINRNRKYLDSSTVKHADCDQAALAAMTSASKLVTGNMTLAYQDLPVKSINASVVEVNRQNWIALYNKTAEQLRIRDWNIFNQTKINETILVQQVKEASDSSF